MKTIVKPTHKIIKTYYETLEGYEKQGVDHELAVRSAFQRLLEDTAKKAKWEFIPELSAEGTAGRKVRPDGTFRDRNFLPRGYWEAKDTHANLDAEIRKKKQAGYPLSNIIFEDTREGVLYQDGREVGRFDLHSPTELCNLLNAFFSYEEAEIEEFGKAVADFKERVPELARGLNDKIKDAHKNNRAFIEAYESFFKLCQESLNPNISRDAVDEMLIQHLLTERVIRKIFDISDFRERNVVAREVEKVITALASESFSRRDYLKSLDRFYVAIEAAADTIEDFSEKQQFLNTVYEQFFQGYSVDLADTHGIVYTPQPIVDFMCASVEEVLKSEFGKTLGDEEVYIIDPATGTGSFIVNLLKRVPMRDIRDTYANRLFANEVMLLPYYIAALNVEHTYFELTGSYEPFEGLCFVDTLDLVKDKQLDMFVTEANTKRIERESKAPITVVIGNPPYNVGQINENDNNKNRKYTDLDRKIRETYVKDSDATLKSKTYDHYKRFFRWAIDRLEGRNGVICYITNNSFIDDISSDGMRKHLNSDFNIIYHFDFKGDARTSGERRRREGGNVFKDKIREGVGITLLVKNEKRSGDSLFLYHTVDDYLKESEKTKYLISLKKMNSVRWERLALDSTNRWFKPNDSLIYNSFLPIASKESKSSKESNRQVIFKTFSLGISTNRDPVVYDANFDILKNRIKQFFEYFNGEVDRYKRIGEGKNIDDFVSYSKIKWSRNLKRVLKRGVYFEYSKEHIRKGFYRPFISHYIYFARYVIDEPGQFLKFFPVNVDKSENSAICIKYKTSNQPFYTLITNIVPDLHLTGDSQCFPFFVYDEDGSNRRENVTDWALAQFREHYGNDSIKKWDIFYYVYGLLHHPAYRETFADNLKRDLPRIPFASQFRPFAKAGEKLADLHLNYEDVEPYPLRWIEDESEDMTYRVEKMRLNKEKTELKVNHYLTLGGIPAWVFDYRLGNRSALDWVIDQYGVKEDKRSGIVSDPNRGDDESYIVDLVGKVVAVSIETVEIVNGLAKLEAWETRT